MNNWPAYKQLGYIEPIRPKGRREGGYEKQAREQEMETKRLAEKQQVELDTARKTEKLKNAKWTRDDLVKLLYHEERILDTHFGEPQTFADDMSLINAQIEKEKGQIKIEGIEKEKISADGIDYMYGLLIQEHVTKQGFYIEIDKNYQPILHDNNANPNEKRKQQKDGLQKALSALEFQYESNSVLRKNDNVSKIATYMTAAAYHGQDEKNLVKYREGLEEKIQKNPNQPLTVDEIKKSNLDAGQKTFLLAWRQRKNDENLIKIQNNQQTYVEQARENYKKKSPEQHLQELAQRPVGKSIELFGAGIIGVGLLAFGLKQMFGEKSGIIGKIFGTIMALVGGVIALPMADKAWQSLGGPEMINGLTTKKPIDRERADDQPFTNIGEGIEEQWMSLKGRIQSLQGRISGPGEWVEMVTRPELTPAVKDYSVGAMLYVLYEGSPTEQNKYSSFKPTEANRKKIKETLGKLATPEEKQTFLKLLETSWKRYGEVNPTIINDARAGKELTLPKIIDEIDMADSWLNYIPGWMGGTGKKAEVLKIIAPKAKEWGEISTERLKKYFVEGLTGPTYDKEIYDLLATGDASKNHDTMAEYIKGLDLEKKESSLPFRFLLNSEK
ncbi:hypothetical protein KA071_02180 [Candidatus Gracilibacteria bacterium]|nr:hypothetical protein [Candidatus Gracilibacteria bacterium]